MIDRVVTPELAKLNEKFKEQGYELRLVGGCVRDLILGDTPKDVDLCTNALPEQSMNIAKNLGFKVIPTGLKHGTITVVARDNHYEVTTLRIDKTTNGRHAEVEFTDSFEHDAARRDLTFNAMSMSLDGQLYDYFGGEQDLKKNRIRFVGDTEKRIEEDYLRILRYFRFAARFGCSMDLLDLEYISKKSSLEGLKTISVERYFAEMEKLLVMPDKVRILEIMESIDVLKTIGLDAPVDSVILARTASATASLSTLVSEKQVKDFVARWKLSRKVGNELVWLKIDAKAIKKSEDYFNALADGVSRDWLIDLSEIRGDEEISAKLKEIAIPKFPVQGNDLIKVGMAPGPEMGQTLKRLRDSWKASGFSKNKDELLKEVSI